MRAPSRTQVDPILELASTIAASSRRGDSSAAATTLIPGTRVGRLIVLRTLGAGGMGVVYAAYDPELDRTVALKLIRATHDGSQSHGARLVREAQALAQLKHPNVVPVFDVGTYSGQVWVSMELVEGRTLRAWICEDEHHWRAVVDVMLQVTRGVAAAHAAGLLHRDIKPANIMLGKDGRVRVMDFGLARVDPERGERDTDAMSTTDEHSALSVALTASGARLGTPAYMAPEQFLGLRADVRTDVFSLCATLWEALYGERAHPGETAAEVERAVLSGELPAPPSDAGVPAWLRRVVARGMAPLPSDRYADIPALEDALRDDPTRRRRLVGIALGVGLVAAASVAGWRFQQAQAINACVATGDSINRVWSAARSDALRGALLGTGVSFASATADKLTPWLDAYTEEWRRTRIELCQRESVDVRWRRELGELAVECLEDRSEHLDGLIEILSSARASGVNQQVIQVSVDSAAALPTIASCADERYLRAHAPRDMGGQRQDQRRLRARVVQSAAHAAAGLYDEALALADDAKRDADALGDPQLAALASFRRGDALESLGRYEEARAAYEGAYLVAGASGENDVYANAAAELAFVVGYHLGRVEDGALWGQTALMLLDRAGVAEDDYLRTPALNALGALYEGRGAHERAREYFQRSLTISEAALGSSHPAVASFRYNLANTYSGLEEYERARSHYERALAVEEATLGPEHPRVATTLTGLGYVLQMLDDHDLALDAYQRAIAILEDSLGAHHPTIAYPLRNLGFAYQQRGDLDRAIEMFTRSLEVLEASLGREHPRVVDPLKNLGDVYFDQGQHSRALVYYVRARDVLDVLDVADPVALAETLDDLADTLEQLDNPEGAALERDRARRLRTGETARPEVDPDATAAADRGEQRRDRRANASKSKPTLQHPAPSELINPFRKPSTGGKKSKKTLQRPTPNHDEPQAGQ